MSLVAYDYSSEEDSDQDEAEELPVASVEVVNNGPSKVSVPDVAPAQKDSVSKLDDLIEDEEESVVHLPLPAPKKITTNDLNVEEEDDEFLRKKAIPEVKPSPLPPPPSLANARSKVRNGKVQITIPSLKDFKDEDDFKPKAKPIVGAELPQRVTGLLGMLPKPKSETAFSVPTPAQNGPTPAAKPIVNRLIPDSVANRPRNVQPGQKSSKKPHPKKADIPAKTTGNDDESSDEDEKLDFFSLNMDEKLPEISSNEINAMVAKRAAKMAEAAKKFDEPEEQDQQQPGTSGLQQMLPPPLPDDSEDLANERALSSLIGGNKAKRARLEEVNIIDISSADIVPTKEDFMRRKLQDATGYVPTGHLTGDWTCTSKRKSHITYLASKAQDNAQELEAMWSANRQSRRQTQSKYGF